MIYLAAPFFNPEQLETIQQVENMLDRHNIKYFSPRKEGGVINDMSADQRQLSLFNVFNSNVEGMLRCDMMLAGLGWRDTGTTWEMGFWYGARSVTRFPLITYAFNGAKANVMLSQSTSGHFVDLRSMERFFSKAAYTSFEDWGRLVDGYSFDYQETSE